MFGFAILDLVIGVTFIYFLLSLVVSAIQEIIANARNLRFVVLQEWLEHSFSNMKDKILQHDLIKSLTHSGKPSYIPSDKFSQAVLDLVHNELSKDKPFDINSLRAAVEKDKLLPDGLKRYVLQSISEANGELAKVRADLAKWYDDAMDRLTGYYKKHVQRVIIFVSFIVVAIFNADSLQIAKYLYENPEAAKALADQASRMVADTTIIEKVKKIESNADTLTKDSETALKEIQADIAEIKTLSAKIYDTKLPLGWNADSLPASDDPEFPLACFEKIFGLILTALAVSLGTPFWFETLSKLVNLRNAGNKPKPETSST